MNKIYTKIFLLSLILTFGCSSVSAVIYQKCGDTYFGTDGSRFQCSNNEVRSNGVTYQRIRDTYYGTDGSRYQRCGNTIHSSNGTMYQKSGNTWIGGGKMYTFED